MVGRAEREWDQRSRHRRIAAHYRARIMSGALAPGARLSSHHELRAQFRVANTTAQRVIAKLKGEGLIATKVGDGVYVRDQPLVSIQAGAYFVAGPGGWSYRVLKVAEVEPPADVATALGLLEGGTAILRRRLSLLADEPLDLSDTYYPLSIAKGTPLASLGKIKGGAPAILEAAGVPERSFTDRVSARLPSAEEMETLRLPDDVPVLRQFRTAHTDSDRVIWVAVLIKGAHLCELLYPDLDATPI